MVRNIPPQKMHSYGRKYATSKSTPATRLHFGYYFPVHSAGPPAYKLHRLPYYITKPSHTPRLYLGVFPVHSTSPYAYKLQCLPIYVTKTHKSSTYQFSAKELLYCTAVHLDSPPVIFFIRLLFNSYNVMPPEVSLEPAEISKQ